MQRIEDSPSERGRAPPPSETKWLLKQVGLWVVVGAVLTFVLFQLLGAWPTC